MNSKPPHSGAKVYDLVDRCKTFALNINRFIKSLPKNMQNQEYARQLIRSSASIGANYIEANESLSAKDFVFRLKIAKKEAKETEYWLQLLDLGDNDELVILKDALLQESIELSKILGAIYSKASP